MKKLVYCFLFLIIHCTPLFAASNTWQLSDADKAPSKKLMVFQPAHYLVFTCNITELTLEMPGLPTDPEAGVVMSLPLPDGTFRNFKVWQTPMMEQQLATRYPEIQTFTAVAVDDARVTAKLDITLYGFHAMIFDGENTSFIDPYDRLNDGFYIVHYKKDETCDAGQRMKCEVSADFEKGSFLNRAQGTGLAQYNATRTGSGWTSRTYRLALSADHQYCQAATGLSSPTIAQALSCMTTSMNRVNGIYEREFSVHMNFCGTEDNIIWPTNTGSVNGQDPFDTVNSNGLACLAVNQTVCTSIIGSGNYDIGHVFTTGGGGISSVGVVCTSITKARSCTGLPSPVGDGFDIDYVAHEMGHEFGSKHTFNNNMDGSCTNNAVAEFAYEPGSGATIMDYAGICSPDDLQEISAPYFSASSLQQIYITMSTTETSCAVTASTGNKLVNVPSFSTTYTIPYKTPFELIGPAAIDSVADTATTYCWTEWDLGDFGKELVNTFDSGPIFRSYQPAYTPMRVFPQTSMVMSGVLSNAGTEGAEGEKVPDTARDLTFKMVFRDIYLANGCFLFPDDSVLLHATPTPTYQGFKVTSQNTTGIGYTGGSTQTVTWNVEGTDAAPVNATNVDIYFSADNGATWPYHLGSFPNSGTASITIPNPASITGAGRLKVKGSGNVFFNVNSNAFTVTHNSAIPITASVSNVASSCLSNLQIFPIPATDRLHIKSSDGNSLDAKIMNSVGQFIWQGQVSSGTIIPVSQWARGVYFMYFTDSATGQNSVRKFVLQ